MNQLVAGQSNGTETNQLKKLDDENDLLCVKCRNSINRNNDDDANDSKKTHPDNDTNDAFGAVGSLCRDVIAKMTVNAKSLFYNMKHKRRGTAIIFNHEHFQVRELKSRSGTIADCSNLRQCLIDLGFDVHVYHDLPFHELYAQIELVSKTDHSECDCFLLAVLSHGESGIIYASDIPYKTEKLWLPFSAERCQTLAGKPKLFFIQACRGDQLDAGVVMTSRTETDGYPSFSYRIPSQADFLIAYSTAPGYYSWRNTTRGSWFIQALCEELRLNGNKLDLLSLLTLVCQRVAVDYESNTPDNFTMHQRKQIPCITSMLTRYVHFENKATTTTNHS